MRIARMIGIVLLLPLLYIMAASIANAGTSEFSHAYVISKAASIQFSASIANADFETQYSSTSGRLQWVYRLPTALRNRSVAGKMDCKAGHIQLGGFTDNHPNIPVDYTWHSSIPGHRQNTNYIFWASCRVMLWEPRGQTGLAEVGLNFNYRIQP